MEASKEHGRHLPSFRNVDEATAALYGSRDATIASFLLACGQELRLDYSPESLKRIEIWYFQQGCPDRHQGFSVARAITLYLGEVLCRKAGFEWIVSSYAFDPTKYEIGVTRGCETKMLSGSWRPPHQGNKRQQSLWREWKRSAL